jgi:hypothetical protein
MRFLCATVVAAAMTVAAPMQVLASETAKGTPKATSPNSSIAASAERAVRAATSDVPVPRPYQGRDRSRKQMGGGGGGKTGMIIGVATALAGTAATIYMVKAMQDSTKQAANAQQ